MTKELEAFVNEVKREQSDYEKMSKRDKRRWPLESSISRITFKYLYTIERVLTPPTSDEVCKAIEKWLRLIPGYENIVAKFDKKINWYFSFDLDKYGRVPVASFISNVPNEVNFHKEVPLELAYLIIRFFKDFADSLEAK